MRHALGLMTVAAAIPMAGVADPAEVEVRVAIEIADRPHYPGIYCSNDTNDASLALTF
jgi:hypothetical protein